MFYLSAQADGVRDMLRHIPRVRVPRMIISAYRRHNFGEEGHGCVIDSSLSGEDAQRAVAEELQDTAKGVVERYWVAVGTWYRLMHRRPVVMKPQWSDEDGFVIRIRCFGEVQYKDVVSLVMYAGGQFSGQYQAMLFPQ